MEKPFINEALLQKDKVTLGEYQTPEGTLDQSKVMSFSDTLYSGANQTSEKRAEKERLEVASARTLLALSAIYEEGREQKGVKTSKTPFDTSDVKFSDFVKGYTGFAPNPETGLPDHIIRGLGLNPSFAKLSEVADRADEIIRNNSGVRDGLEKFTLTTQVTSGGYQWLVPTFILSVLQQVQRKEEALFPKLIGRTYSIGDAREVVLPYIKAGDTTPTVKLQGSQPTLATFTLGQKIAKLYAYEKGLEVHDDAMRKINLPFLPMLMSKIYQDFERVWDANSVYTILNGDQQDASEAVMSVGVTSANALTFKDLVRIQTIFTNLGISGTKMLTHKNTAINIATLPEFLGLTDSTGFKVAALNMPAAFYPSINSMSTSDAYPNDGTLLVYTSAAMSMLNGMPLTVKSARSVGFDEVTSYKIMEAKGFMTEDMLMRLKIDPSETIQDLPIPSAFDINFNTIRYPLIEQTILTTI